MTAPAYRVDGREAASEIFYAHACDPQRSVVVEACAGAGKTWMLVSRLLRALLEGAEPTQVLAITFTRKAAGEMRNRLDEWVRDLAAADADVQLRELRARGLGAAEAQALLPRLVELPERLLRDGRSVPVLTFHAWFAQLLGQAPQTLRAQLGLPPVHELLEDTALLSAELNRALFRRVQADPALREAYAGLVRRHRRGGVERWLDAARQQIGTLARADEAGVAAGSVPPAHALWPDEAGRDHAGRAIAEPTLGLVLDELARQLGGSGKSLQVKAAERLRSAREAKDPADALAAAWQALYNDEGEPRQRLGQHPLLAPAAEAILGLRDRQLQREAHADQQALLQLSRVLRQEYAALKRRRGLVDMDDLERMAEQLLGDSTMAGWVQERLDQRLRQVLVDEFQDTNPAQWQLLLGWLSSYGGAGGGASGRQGLSVFIVGDPKQSIYRFRGAEAGVFQAARDFVVQGLGGHALACDHTRRCAPSVVAAVNAVFGAASAQGGWLDFRPHSTASDAAGRVWRLPGVERPPPSPRAPRSAPAEAADDTPWRDPLTEPLREPDTVLAQQEAVQVAQAVGHLLAHEGLRPEDVMVLARRRVTLAHVADALAAAGVPHVLAADLKLHETAEALDLAAVVDVLVSPQHDLSLARALRSPLFGVSDDALLALSDRARRQRRGWLPTLLAEPPFGGAELERARALLQAWQACAARLTPHELLDRIVHEGDLVARLAARVPAARRAAAQHELQSVLSATLAHGAGRWPSAYGWLRSLKAGELKAMGAVPPGAVRLFTVHSAKGLEAPAVVVCDCDAAPPREEQQTLLVDWPAERQAPRALAFARSRAYVPPSLRALCATQDAAEARERLNALYVAMTRAERILVFSRTERSPAHGPPSWWDRVQPHADAWTPQPATVAPLAAAVDDACVPELPVPPTGLPGLAPALRPLRAPAADPPAARLGQAVHRLLEWAAARAPVPGPAELVSWAASACGQAGLPAAAAPEVAAAAAAVLSNPDSARFFDPARLLWAGNEVPLAGPQGLMRIDRLVALAGTDHAREWWVLDYKLAERPDTVAAYREQLAAYVAAVQALQPGEPVHAAFIAGQGRLVPL